MPPLLSADLQPAFFWRKGGKASKKLEQTGNERRVRDTEAAISPLLRGTLGSPPKTALILLCAHTF